MRSALLVVSSLWAAAIAPGIARAQCRPIDQNGNQFKYDIGLYAGAIGTDPKASIRNKIKLDSVPATQVTLVTKSATCSKANAAYQLKLAGTGGPPFSGQVYVLQVGSTYAVMDPAFYYDSQLPKERVIVIMDSKFKALSKF